MIYRSSLRAFVVSAALFAGSSALAQSAGQLVREAEEMLSGSDDPASVQKAEDLLFQAIDRGNARALFVLGSLYLTNDNFANERDRGLTMISEAAALEHKPAILYLFGYYLEKNAYDNALEILTPLAGQGDIGASLRLAEFYVSDEGSYQDFEKARFFLDQAVTQSGGDQNLKRTTDRILFVILRGQLESGRGDVAAILTDLEKMAADNNPQAVSLLSKLYMRGGDGIEADTQKGIGYLAKSAELGSASASFQLGREFINGTLIDRDVDKGIALIESASDAGVAAADLFLAERTLDGTYDGLSIEKARQFLNSAAEEGNSAAARSLAKYLAGLTGEGANSDDALALARKVAQDGSESNRLLLSDLLLRDPTPANADEARVLLEGLAQEGSARAVRALIQLNLDGQVFPRDEQTANVYIAELSKMDLDGSRLFLSNLYLSGELLDENPVLGFQYLKEAFAAGDPRAAVPYARALLEGELVDQDIGGAIQVLEDAADANNTAAKAALSRLYLEEGAAYSNKTKGIGLLEELAQDGADNRAAWRLGRTFLRGDGVDIDIDKAIAYLRQASDAGHAQAPLLLGREYFNGRNVGRDYRLAQQYLETALERGNSQALITLGDIYWRNRDNTRALAAYQNAADGGETAGAVKLGLAYLNARRLPGRRSEGLQILDELSKSGDVQASLSLASVFSEGKFDMPVDTARALSYFDAAVATGDARAAGERLAFLASINLSSEDMPKLAILFGELPPDAYETFVNRSFNQSEKQLAYIVQEKLKALGFYGGPLDGLFGRGSETAILLFCQDDALNGPCDSPVWSSGNALRVLAFQKN